MEQEEVGGSAEAGSIQSQPVVHRMQLTRNITELVHRSNEAEAGLNTPGKENQVEQIRTGTNGKRSLCQTDQRLQNKTGNPY